MAASLPTESFGLIICLGVMAHMLSPGDFVARIVTLLKPGGSLILEFTDAFSLAGGISRFFRSFKEFFAAPLLG